MIELKFKQTVVFLALACKGLKYFEVLKDFRKIFGLNT